MKTNIFESLRKDHDIQRKLLQEIVQTSGETEKRKRLFLQLKHELKIHADAEERYFYIPLIEEDKTQEMARHGVAEHHEMDELVEQLEETEMDSPAWLKHAKSLQDKVLHHLEDEEQEFFQMAGKVLDRKDKNTLANDYKEHMSAKRSLELS